MWLASYKGKERLFNKVTSTYLRGKYSHSEIVLEYLPSGEARCASSSIQDKGVRVKTMHLNHDNWDIVELPPNITKENAEKWLTEHEHYGYDYLGLINFICGVFGQSETRVLCSEACAEMIGLKEGWRFNPCTLHNAALWLRESYLSNLNK